MCNGVFQVAINLPVAEGDALALQPHIGLNLKKPAAQRKTQGQRERMLLIGVSRWYDIIFFLLFFSLSFVTALFLLSVLSPLRSEDHIKQASIDGLAGETVPGRLNKWVQLGH